MEEQNEIQSESTGLTQEKKSRFHELRSLISANLPKYVIEIFVIIIGITLSFFIDNQKEEAARKALEKVYIRNLLIDVNEDIGKLTGLIEGSKQVVNSANYILQIAETENVNKLNADQFSFHWFKLFYWKTFVSSEATFSDLKSGNTQFISQPGLRASLFNYYTFLESIKEEEKVEHDQMIGIVQPYFFQHFYMKGINTSKPIVRPNADDWNELKSYMFGNVISTRFIQRRNLIRIYEEALALAKRLKLNLEERII